MSDIFGDYDVYYENTSVGKLTVEREGAAYLLTCSCRQISSDILRLYCVSGEKSISLGVMLPQGGELVLKKRLTKNALGEMGLSKISRCYLRGKEEPAPKKEKAPEIVVENKPPVKREMKTWLPAPDPASLFSDQDISSACSGVTGALSREDGDCRLLAIPIVSGAPFPLMPIFCFGYSENIGGTNFAVFRIRDGLLIP